MTCPLDVGGVSHDPSAVRSSTVRLVLLAGTRAFRVLPDLACMVECPRLVDDDPMTAGEVLIVNGPHMNLRKMLEVGNPRLVLLHGTSVVRYKVYWPRAGSGGKDWLDKGTAYYEGYET